VARLRPAEFPPAEPRRECEPHNEPERRTIEAFSVPTETVSTPMTAFLEESRITTKCSRSCPSVPCQPEWDDGRTWIQDATQYFSLPDLGLKAIAPTGPPMAVGEGG
jgi:hypothetical protein